MQNFRAHQLALSVINDGTTYAARKAVALALAAGNHSLTLHAEAVRGICNEQAIVERHQFNAKYSVADVTAAALEVAEHDRSELMEDLRMTTDSISASAREWFDKQNGNSYHSCYVYIGDKLVYIPMQYGYGEQWKQTVMQWLISNEVIADEGYTTRDRIQWGSIVSGLKRDL